MYCICGEKNSLDLSGFEKYKAYNAEDLSSCSKIMHNYYGLFPGTMWIMCLEPHYAISHPHIIPEALSLDTEL